jgi:PIN domain nuclease of toxin-antitoxin system
VILLDTHVLVWLSTEPTKLSKHATSAVRRASRAGGIGISAISLWELAWLATHGRLQLTGTVEAYLEEISSRVAVLPITTKVAALAAEAEALDNRYKKLDNMTHNLDNIVVASSVREIEAETGIHENAK